MSENKNINNEEIESTTATSEHNNVEMEFNGNEWIPSTEDNATTENKTEESVSTESDMPGVDWSVPQPVVIGRPRPTDELNPELAAMEKERREREKAENNEAAPEGIFDGIFGQDYSKLFEAYKNIIEALDQNVNYVKHRAEVANRRSWVAVGVAVIALILAIVK